MDEVRMVHLRTVQSDFHARVIAARLGADGMLTEVRGGSGIYPGSAISVFIDEQDLDSAQELLMADEVEDAFVEPIYDVERGLFVATGAGRAQFVAPGAGGALFVASGAGRARWRLRLMVVTAIVLLAWSGVAFRVV
jgi:hypothetical protein